MKHNTTSDPNLKMMTMREYNFLCETLQEEIMQHPHKDELLQLIHDQMCDYIM